MRKVFLLLLVGVMLLSGCSALDTISNEIVDQVSNVVQSTDKYVMTIQNANMNGTTYTYKDVFSNFFAYPTWKHFTSDDGQEVVEFTGECTYDNQDVKALIQFVITNETEDYVEWETTYLSFNNVSQPNIMLFALLEKAVMEYDNKTAHDIEIMNNGIDLHANKKEIVEIYQQDFEPEEYAPTIYLYNDGTFVFKYNFSEGMDEYTGKWSMSYSPTIDYYFEVDDTEYYSNLDFHLYRSADHAYGEFVSEHGHGGEFGMTHTGDIFSVYIQE